MNQTEYRKTTESELKGRRYRLVRDVATTSGMTARAGTVVTIVRKFSGLGLQTDTCEHCGVSFRCSQVDPGHLGERVS